MNGTRPYAHFLALLAERVAAPWRPQKRGPGNLHPRDARGQYVSPKPTSKRNRNAGVKA